MPDSAHLNSSSDTLPPPKRWLTAAERQAIRAILGHHHIVDVNEVADTHLSTGQRIADGVARIMGSWLFIIIQSIMLLSWLTFNVIGWIRHWDPYPFILLNLALSFQAAYSAPIIMMSQNRQALKDRIAAEHDYRVNLHAELEISEVRTQLQDIGGRQWNELVELQTRQLELLTRIEHLTSEVHRLSVQQSGKGEA